MAGPGYHPPRLPGERELDRSIARLEADGDEMERRLDELHDEEEGAEHFAESAGTVGEEPMYPDDEE
jgi:hypothetical protein